jgi:hypothetical protein
MLGCHQQQNLGEHARAKAISVGVILSGVALGWALLSTELGVAKQLGWLLAVPLALSAYLLISGALGICVVNGFKGSRTEDHGGEQVLDPDARSRLRLRALYAVSASLLIACAFTLAFVANS